MGKNNLRIRSKAKVAYLDDLMLILNSSFIAFFCWGLKALCFQYFFFEGRGEFLRFDNFFLKRLTVKDGWGRPKLPYPCQEKRVSKKAK